MNRWKMTQDELDCIRFYMGDLEIVLRGDFLGGPKAYNTINAILHEDIINELDKISEGKPIEVLNEIHLKQMVSLIQKVDSAMKKMGTDDSLNTPLITYRVDRMSEIESMLQNRRIEGFYSTCKYGFLSEYANTKQNVVLMEIEREKDVPYLDFERLFESMYAKPQEAEILLPFDCEVKSVTELLLSEQEKKRYHDMHGNPPKGKYHIVLGPRERSRDIHRVSFEELTSPKNAEEISLILRQLSERGELSNEQLEFYGKWKKDLKMILEND